MDVYQNNGILHYNITNNGIFCYGKSKLKLYLIQLLFHIFSSFSWFLLKLMSLVSSPCMESHKAHGLHIWCIGALFHFTSCTVDLLGTQLNQMIHMAEHNVGGDTLVHSRRMTTMASSSFYFGSTWQVGSSHRLAYCKQSDQQQMTQIC